MEQKEPLQQMVLGDLDSYVQQNMEILLKISFRHAIWSNNWTPGHTCERHEITTSKR